MSLDVDVPAPPELQEVDLEPLSSSPDNPRWRNAAQWARYSMVKKGLLKSDSPRGIWELTDKGMQQAEKANKK